jgi:hypothetical protein
LDATRHGFVPVVHIMRRRGHHDAGTVFLQNPRQLARHAFGRPYQVIGQRDVEGRVEDHGLFGFWRGAACPRVTQK